MEEVYFVNETLRVANDEYDGYSVDSECGALDARNRVETTVRKAMMYKESEHGTVEMYEV